MAWYFITLGAFGSYRLVAPLATELRTLNSTNDENNAKVMANVSSEGNALPVYSMANYFLDYVLHTRNIKELADKVDLSNLSAVRQSLSENKSLWASHYSSFVVCAAVAVIWSVGLCIWGCIICCRHFMNTLPPRGRDFQYTSRWRRVGALLLVVACVMLLFGCVNMLLANQILRRQTDDGEITRQLSNTVDRLETFRLSTANRLRAVRERFMNACDTLGPMLDNATFEFRNSIKPPDNDLSTNITKLLDKFEQIASYLVAVNEKTNALTKNVGLMASRLSRMRRAIKTDFHECAMENFVCDTALMYADMIATDRMDAEGLKDSLAGLTTAAIANRDTVATMVGDTSALLETESSQRLQHDATVSRAQSLLRANFIQPMNETIQRSRNTILRHILSVRDAFESSSLDAARRYIAYSLEPWIQKHAKYRTMIGYVLGAFFVAVITACLVGLFFGVFGERAKPARRRSTPTPLMSRERAVTALRIAAGFIFALGWALIVVTSVLFIIGGISYVDVCRHFVKPWPQTDNSRFVRDTIGHHLNLPFSLHVAMETCDNGGSVFTAFSLDDVSSSDVNATNVTPSAFVDSRKWLEDVGLKKVPRSNISEFDAYTISEILVEITKLQIMLESLDFVPYREKLHSGSFLSNVDNLLTYLNTSLTEQSVKNDPFLVNLFKRYTLSVSKLRRQQTKVLETGKRNVLSAIENAETRIESAALNIVELTYSTKNRNHYNQSVAGSFDSTVKSLTDELAKAFSVFNRSPYAETSIGCKQASDAVSASVDGICFNVVRPLNGFWFSTGFCAFFLMPTLVIAIILSRLYGNTRQYRHAITLKDINQCLHRTPNSKKGNDWLNKKLPKEDEKGKTSSNNAPNRSNTNIINDVIKEEEEEEGDTEKCKDGVQEKRSDGGHNEQNAGQRALIDSAAPIENNNDCKDTGEQNVQKCVKSEKKTVVIVVDSDKCADGSVQNTTKTDHIKDRSREEEKHIGGDKEKKPVNDDNGVANLKKQQPPPANSDDMIANDRVRHKAGDDKLKKERGDDDKETDIECANNVPNTDGTEQTVGKRTQPKGTKEKHKHRDRKGDRAADSDCASKDRHKKRRTSEDGVAAAKSKQKRDRKGDKSAYMSSDDNAHIPGRRRSKDESVNKVNNIPYTGNARKLARDDTQANVNFIEGDPNADESISLDAPALNVISAVQKGQALNEIAPQNMFVKVLLPNNASDATKLTPGQPLTQSDIVISTVDTPKEILMQPNNFDTSGSTGPEVVGPMISNAPHLRQWGVSDDSGHDTQTEDKQQNGFIARKGKRQGKPKRRDHNGHIPRRERRHKQYRRQQEFDTMSQTASDITSCSNVQPARSLVISLPRSRKDTCVNALPPHHVVYQSARGGVHSDTEAMIGTAANHYEKHKNIRHISDRFGPMEVDSRGISGREWIKMSRQHYPPPRMSVVSGVDGLRARSFALNGSKKRRRPKESTFNDVYAHINSS